MGAVETMKEQFGPRGGGAMKNVAIFAAVLVLSVALLAAGPVQAQTINMDFKGADIRDVLQVLGELGGFNVVTDREVSGDVTVYLRDMDVREAIDLVVKMNGYDHTMVGNTLVVASPQRLAERFAKTDTRFIPVQHVEPATLVSPLQFAVPGLTVQADAAGRGLLVRGDDQQLARAAAFVRERDVAPPPQMDFVDTDTLTILRSLAVQGGFNLIASDTVSGKQTVFLRDLSVKQAIALVASQAGLDHVFEGNNLFITPMIESTPEPKEPERPVREAEVEPEPAQPQPAAPIAEKPSADAPPEEPVPVVKETVRIFDVHYIEPRTAADVVSLVVPAAGVRIEGTSRKLLVRGTDEQLAQAAELLKEQDRPSVRLEGVVMGGDGARAILAFADGSYVVREGSRVNSVVVQSISDKEAVLRTVHGLDLRVFIGGGE